MSISMSVRTVRPGSARLVPGPRARVRRTAGPGRISRDALPTRSAMPCVAVLDQPGLSRSITAMPVAARFAVTVREGAR